MQSEIPGLSIEVFSTCPQSSAVSQTAYLQQVIDVASWSEQNGCHGILVYTDNSLVDPWLIAQIIIQNTTTLCPLVAVQPMYMHPYTVAKKVTSFGYLYGRRIYLNMVAGGFSNDLAALNDATPHDKRYERLTEYTMIIRELLASQTPVSYAGTFYQVDNLKLTPPLPEDLFPGIFLSGSSEAGIAAARALGARVVKYPQPTSEYEGRRPDTDLDSGIRIGIIAREGDREAWDIAYRRFPADRRGQLMHQLAMKTSDSVWHKHLSQLADATAAQPGLYWMHPFQNYRTFCPYLVGDYGQVSAEIARYIAVGFKTFILDIPPSEEELAHIRIVFERASRSVVR